MTKKGRGAAPIHPGEILLEEFLKSYDPPVSQVEAADRMHIPKVRLNQLIRGNRGVTPDTALRLADLTGTSAEFWMNLQCRYDPLACRGGPRRPEGIQDPSAREGQLETLALQSESVPDGASRSANRGSTGATREGPRPSVRARHPRRSSHLRRSPKGSV